MNRPPEETKASEPAKRPEPRIGQTIVFKLLPSKTHKAPFGVGKLLNTNVAKYDFQWLGNENYEPQKTFRNGFYDPKDGKGYYQEKRHYHTQAVDRRIDRRGSRRRRRHCPR